jgi:hypothetical protein
MASAKFKFVAGQARTIHQYKNTRTKILKCNADIYFNRQSLAKKVTPNYANIKIPITSPASRTTQNKICIIRLKPWWNFDNIYIITPRRQ